MSVKTPTKHSLREIAADAFMARAKANDRLGELSKMTTGTPAYKAAASRFDAEAATAKAAEGRFRAAAEITNGDPVPGMELAREGHVDVRDGAPIRVGGEPSVYGVGSKFSFLKDQYECATRGRGDARERIERSYRELADRGIITRDEQRAIGETAGAGGELVAPVFMQKMWVDAARVGRPFLNNVFHLPLPDFTDEVEIPAIEQGEEPQTAAQSDLGAGKESTTKTISGNLKHRVITVAGNVLSAVQEFERAVPSLYDFAVFPSLLDDYMTETDIEALTGSGVEPHALGLLEVAGTTKIKLETWTLANPETILKAFAEAIKSTWAERHRSPDLCLMHPNRWAAICSLTDAQKRPLVSIKAFQPQPAQAPPVTEVGSVVGEIMGIPVVLDGNLPTNLGAATNQDIIAVMHSQDIWFLEEPRCTTRVYRDIEGNTEGKLRLQVFGYSATFNDRHAAGVSLIEGKGLVAPTL